MSQQNLRSVEYADAAKPETELRNRSLEPSAVVTFEEVYRTCGAKVLNLAFKLTQREDTARELTQEIFVRVYKNLDKFEQRSTVSTWVYRIATNHILNFLKHERRRRWKEVLNKTIGESFEDEASSAPAIEGVNMDTPVDVAERIEREKIVSSSVHTLPIKYRVPLVLYHYEGLSYQEIADHLKLSLSAVESRIYRAKQLLIKKLQPYVGQL
jgi:RNA polymerase sigma-70 factor (ECF subfamily)